MEHLPPKFLDPITLGKIQLSRFLELTPARFRTFVKMLESDPETRLLSPLVETGTLEGICFTPHQKGDPALIGEIVSNGFFPNFHYHCECFIREFRFDDRKIEHFLRDGSGNEALRKILRRMRLVNSRNRMTRAMIEFLIYFQFDYLRAGDPLLLKPLTLSQTLRHLSRNSAMGLFDQSRLSRVLRHTLVSFPDGAIGPLTPLSPSSRDLSCHFVESVIKIEKIMISEGKIADPYTDSEIAAEVFSLSGQRISRRTVTYIRRTMGIPGSRERARERTYLDATEDFSSPFSLTANSIRTFVPQAPGVYEIRSFIPGIPEKIIYIGSAGNLRKRLTYHLYAKGTNPRLWKKISLGARARFKILKEDPRIKEKELYRAFRSTFGQSPDCNKISP